MNKIKALLKRAKSEVKKAMRYARPRLTTAKILVVNYSKAALKLAKALARKTENSVIRPIIIATKRFIRRAPRAFAAIVAVFMLLTGTASVAIATEATTAYNVVYKGETLCTILDAEVLAEAEILAAKKLDNEICNKYIADVSLRGTVAPSKALVSADALSNILIDNSYNILKATLVYVDNRTVATEKDNQSAKTALDDYLTLYKQENSVDTVKLSSLVTYENIYTTKPVVESLPTVAELTSSNSKALPVHTVTTVTEVRDIDYKTVETKSSDYTAGTKVVMQSGKKGSEEVTFELYMEDGIIVEKKEISTKVLTAPVDKKVIVGSKRVVVESNKGSYPMIWPLKRVSGAYVSSYVGDGRNHKGMDLVSKSGTPIYAAEAGTVVKSGWDTSGYGYKVVIQHKNGISTLYAHCSALYVKAGDEVAQGETIAAVGNTGRSTGSHLHFEVRINGVFTNPANYIGRK